MKVYELMKLLEKMPAGAKVKMKLLATEKELEDSELKVEFTEEKHYSIVRKAADVALDGRGSVVLYGE